MSTYGNFCPVSMGADVVADRWTPLILRELVMGNRRFNDLVRGLPGISRSLLVQRLRHLERKGVLERTPTAAGHEYRLTPAGADLERVVMAIGEWSVRWLYNEHRPREVSALTLLWWMHRRVDLDLLPARRVIVEFRFTGDEVVTAWIVLDPQEVSVCRLAPTADADVTVNAAAGDLGQVFLGFETWAQAMRRGAISVDGIPELARSVPGWFRTSPFGDSLAEMAREFGIPGHADFDGDGYGRRLADTAT